jgi:hypothetical protein
MILPLARTDSALEVTQLAHWRHNETELILLQDDIKSCYTMRLVKNGKNVGEVNSEMNNVAALVVLLLDKIPIDPKHIKLN